MSERTKLERLRVAPALFGLTEVAPGTFEGDGLMFIPQQSALVMFYSLTGNALLEVMSGFPSETRPARGMGSVVLEQTSTGGASWAALDCLKLGRGMHSNATSTSPCRFRAALMSNPGGAHGIRLRCSETPLFKPFEVRITFAGHQHRHVIRRVDEFLIQEMPG